MNLSSGFCIVLNLFENSSRRPTRDGRCGFRSSELSWTIRGGHHVPLARGLVTVSVAPGTPNTEQARVCRPANLRWTGEIWDSVVPGLWDSDDVYLDARIPEETTPGVKTFAIWVTDDEGRIGTTTASLQIVARR